MELTSAIFKERLKLIQDIDAILAAQAYDDRCVNRERYFFPTQPAVAPYRRLLEIQTGVEATIEQVDTYPWTVFRLGTDNFQLWQSTLSLWEQLLKGKILGFSADAEWLRPRVLTLLAFAWPFKTTRTIVAALAQTAAAGMKNLVEPAGGFAPYPLAHADPAADDLAHVQKNLPGTAADTGMPADLYGAGLGGAALNPKAPGGRFFVVNWPKDFTDASMAMETNNSRSTVNTGDLTFVHELGHGLHMNLATLRIRRTCLLAAKGASVDAWSEDEEYVNINLVENALRAEMKLVSRVSHRGMMVTLDPGGVVPVRPVDTGPQVVNMILADLGEHNLWLQGEAPQEELEAIKRAEKPEAAKLYVQSYLGQVRKTTPERAKALEAILANAQHVGYASILERGTLMLDYL